MEFNTRLKQAAVIGAAGKMGRGISAMIAHQMALLKAADTTGGLYRLYLIDASETALDDLLVYIEQQVRKQAENGIVEMREKYSSRPDLIENGEIVSAHLSIMRNLLRPGTDLAAASGASLIFEAIVEDLAVKRNVYQTLGGKCGADTFFLTNTSSIPISVLEKEGNLSGRIIGYHFYNPPPVQKLVEVISTAQTLPELKEVAVTLGKRLRKTLVSSNDVAGFIGNGHFTRDGLYGLAGAQALVKEFSWPGAIYAINRISQDYLIRPMGIFQLIDYVGIDVFSFILNVMKPHHPSDGLHSPLIDLLLSQGVRGGQAGDGSQRDGFFRYQKGRPIAAWNPEKQNYEPLAGPDRRLDKFLGELPAGHLPWKTLLGSVQRDAVLKKYFAGLWELDTPGAKLAQAYMKRSKEIGEQLVHTGVAASAKEVNDVLTLGFYHLYGPINDYVPETVPAGGK